MPISAFSCTVIAAIWYSLTIPPYHSSIRNLYRHTKQRGSPILFWQQGSTGWDAMMVPADYQNGLRMVWIRIAQRALKVTVTARFAAFNWYTSLDRSPDFSLGATLGSNFILDRECAGFPGDSMGLALLEMPRQALPLSGSVCTGTIQIGEHITT